MMREYILGIIEECEGSDEELVDKLHSVLMKIVHVQKEMENADEAEAMAEERKRVSREKMKSQSEKIDQQAVLEKERADKKRQLMLDQANQLGFPMEYFGVTKQEE